MPCFSAFVEEKTEKQGFPQMWKRWFLRSSISHKCGKYDFYSLGFPINVEKAVFVCSVFPQMWKMRFSFSHVSHKCGKCCFLSVGFPINVESVVFIRPVFHKCGKYHFHSLGFSTNVGNALFVRFIFPYHAESHFSRRPLFPVLRVARGLAGGRFFLFSSCHSADDVV